MDVLTQDGGSPGVSKSSKGKAMNFERLEGKAHERKPRGQSPEVGIPGR
jgi:hypothetical protein